MTGFYSYYVPDFTYDAFVLSKDKWILQEDVAGVNAKGDEKLKVMVQNKNTGKLESVEIKDKWIDPSDENAAAGGSKHVARTPLDEAEDKNKISRIRALFVKKEKKYKPDTYSTYPYSEINRRKKRNRKASI